MSKRIITIGRQYGSNGHMIGTLLAKKLGINFYDKELIQIASEQMNIPYEQLVLVDEKKESPWRYEADIDSHLARQYRFGHIDRKLFDAQSQVISNLAQKEDCVIVGRCADYILKDLKTVTHAYLYAPYESRIHTVMERDHLNEKDAERLVRHMDKERAYYYKYYTDQIWDDLENYDLCLNTTALGMEGTLRILERTFRYW